MRLSEASKIKPNASIAPFDSRAAHRGVSITCRLAATRHPGAVTISALAPPGRGLPRTPGTASRRVLGSRACSSASLGWRCCQRWRPPCCGCSPADDPTARLAAFIPYGLLGYLIALSCLLVVVVRARHRLVPTVITVGVAALTACHLAWLVPLFVNDHRPAATTEFRLMSLNMFNGEADSREVAKRAANADIVILVEATPAALSNLKPFGWDKRFPYSLGDPKDGFTNTAVYSRFPLSHSQLINDTSFQQWVTTARVPKIGSVRLMAVHPCNPYCGGALEC